MPTAVAAKEISTHAGVTSKTGLFFTTCFHFSGGFNPESSVVLPPLPPPSTPPPPTNRPTQRHLLESGRADVLPRSPAIHVEPEISAKK